MKRRLNQRRAASRRGPPCFLKMTTDYFVRLYHPRFSPRDSTPRVLVLCGRAPRLRPCLPTTHTTRPSELIITVYFVRRRYAVPPPSSSLRWRSDGSPGARGCAREGSRRVRIPDQQRLHSLFFALRLGGQRRARSEDNVWGYGAQCVECSARLDRQRRKAGLSTKKSNGWEVRQDPVANNPRHN